MRVFFEPGKYYIGDLCYVINDHDEWMSLVDQMFPDRLGGEGIEGEFRLRNGSRVAIFSTLHGDGVYPDGSGKGYPVDSGSIGIIKFSDIEITKDNFKGLEYGNVVEFSNQFSCYSNGDGVLVFGNIRIDTNDYYDEDEDEDY